MNVATQSGAHDDRRRRWSNVLHQANEARSSARLALVWLQWRSRQWRSRTSAPPKVYRPCATRLANGISSAPAQRCVSPWLHGNSLQKQVLCLLSWRVSTHWRMGGRPH